MANEYTQTPDPTYNLTMFDDGGQPIDDFSLTRDEYGELKRLLGAMRGALSQEAKQDLAAEEASDTVGRNINRQLSEALAAFIASVAPSGDKLLLLNTLRAYVESRDKCLDLILPGVFIAVAGLDMKAAAPRDGYRPDVVALAIDHALIALAGFPSSAATAERKEADEELRMEVIQALVGWVHGASLINLIMLTRMALIIDKANGNAPAEDFVLQLATLPWSKDTGRFELDPDYAARQLSEFRSNFEDAISSARNMTAAYPKLVAPEMEAA